MNKPGDIDTSFSAHCPKCGCSDWFFTDNPDSRLCANAIGEFGCDYIHWLRGPNQSEKVLPPEFVPHPALKKERVRELVFAIIASSDLRPFVMGASLSETKFSVALVNVACAIDDEIEAIK